MTQPKQLSISAQEFDTGDFYFLGNVFDHPIEDGRLVGLNSIYGEGTAFAGSAYSRETGSATGIPGLIGIYVTKQAIGHLLHNVS